MRIRRVLRGLDQHRLVLGRRRASLGALALAALACLSGCLLFAGRHWEETRRGVIEPLNSSLHRHLARDIKDKNLDAILAVYATATGTGLPWREPEIVPDRFEERRLRWVGPPAEEPIRDRYERLLAMFASVDKADVRINRVFWDRRDRLGYPADLHLLVRGVAPDGARRMLEQWARTHIASTPTGAWAVTAEEVRWRELVETKRPRFELATERSGIHDVHDTTGSPVFRLIGDQLASGGSAVADVDGDGREDLALLSASHVALYRNRGDGTFEDVSARAGFAGAFDVAATGLVFFDADNDGDPDLWVSGIYGDRFYRNHGGGTFVDASAAAGLEPGRWGSMPIVADYDRDGLLDVYVVRMGDHEHAVPQPNWQAVNGVPHTLYRNLGGGRFANVTHAAGIDERGWGLAGAWGDYDNDGYPDLYVGNEFGFNSLWRNNRDGTFSNLAAMAGALDRGAAMGVAWGDVDGDGNLDLFVSNMYANSRWVLFHPDFPPPVPWYYSWLPRSSVDRITDELTRGCTLLHNNGDGTFTDVSDSAGVRDAQWSWGVEFLDYNDDGLLDLYVGNGFVSGAIPDDI